MAISKRAAFITLLILLTRIYFAPKLRQRLIPSQSYPKMSNITIKTASHSTNTVTNRLPPSPEPIPADNFFRYHPAYDNCIKRIIGTNYAGDNKTQFRSNGFVQTVVSAYSGHHDLIIRPDDIWIAILSQFSFYLNANAEKFRTQFVAHEGKKELVVLVPPTSLEGIDWDSFGDKMVEKMHEELVDKDLKYWIIPNFTTTTRTDSTVSAILMMATLKHYFTYTMQMLCGIPHVTLEGTRDDYQSILSRLDKLDSWDNSTRAWAKMLKPILRKFIAAFDGEVDLDFWGHIVSEHHYGSGSSELGGWITAFSAISEKGLFTAGQDVLPNEMWGNPRKPYKLDGVPYPVISFSELAPGHAEVDLKIIDAGGVEYATALTAGNMGMKIENNDTSLRNVPIWACYLKDEEKGKKLQQEEDARWGGMFRRFRAKQNQ